MELTIFVTPANHHQPSFTMGIFRRRAVTKVEWGRFFRVGARKGSHGRPIYDEACYCRVSPPWRLIPMRFQVSETAVGVDPRVRPSQI